MNTVHAFEITLINASGRYTRTAVAPTAAQAIRTAIGTFIEPEGPFALTCHILPGLEAELEEEQQPCAA
jgi:hypothetical protein